MCMQVQENQKEEHSVLWPVEAGVVKILGPESVMEGDIYQYLETKGPHEEGHLTGAKTLQRRETASL